MNQMKLEIMCFQVTQYHLGVKAIKGALLGVLHERYDCNKIPLTCYFPYL